MDEVIFVSNALCESQCILTLPVCSPSSSHNAFNQTATLVAVESAIHYASVVDRATTDCKFDLHETVLPQTLNT